MTPEKLFEARIEEARSNLHEIRQSTEMPYIIEGGATYEYLADAGKFPKEARELEHYLNEIACTNLERHGYRNRLVTLDVMDCEAKNRRGEITISVRAGHDSEDEDSAEELLFDMIDEAWSEAIEYVLGNDFLEQYPPRFSKVDRWID